MNMDKLEVIWVKHSVKKKLLQKKLDLNLKTINDVIVKYQDSDN